MIVIRLTRIGKTNEPAYRIVVAEKQKSVKGAFLEILGYYNPSENKKNDFKKDRVEFWIKNGAKPSDTMASFFKANGMEGMDKFISPRNLKRKKKNAAAEEKTVAAAEAPAEAVKEEKIAAADAAVPKEETTATADTPQ